MANENANKSVTLGALQAAGSILVTKEEFREQISEVKEEIPREHRQLKQREEENQHPISAIIHLEEKLSAIPTPMTADELRKILMS